MLRPATSPGQLQSHHLFYYMHTFYHDQFDFSYVHFFLAFDIVPKVRRMACGGEHSVFVCSDDEVYVAGTGARGQLGLGRDSEQWSNCFYPVLNKSLKASGRSILDVAAGNNCTLILAGKYKPVQLSNRCAGKRGVPIMSLKTIP